MKWNINTSDHAHGLKLGQMTGSSVRQKSLKEVSPPGDFNLVCDI